MPTLSAETLAALSKGIDRLSPADRRDFQQSIAYMNLMKKLQPLLLQEQPKMSEAEYHQALSEVSRMEEQGFFSFSEAAGIEKHLAGSQYGGTALEAEQKRIDDLYRKKYQEALERNDPRNDPKNFAYQAAEHELIQRALGMDNYPGGISRDDYLAEETEKLRLRIYGGAGESSGSTRQP